MIYAGKLYDPILNFFDLVGKARYYTYDLSPGYYDVTASGALWTNWKYTTCFNEIAGTCTVGAVVVLTG